MRIPREKIDKNPPYVRLAGLAFRRKKDMYWNDKYEWGVHFHWLANKRQMIAITDNKTLNRSPLIPITEKEYFAEVGIEGMVAEM